MTAAVHTLWMKHSHIDKPVGPFYFCSDGCRKRWWVDADAGHFGGTVLWCQPDYQECDFASNDGWWPCDQCGIRFDHEGMRL